MSTPFTATSYGDTGNFSGLMDAICQNGLIRWLANQNKFTLLALVIILLLSVLIFRFYTSDLKYYAS